MKSNIFIIIGLMMISLLSLCSAQVYKTGELSDLKFTCTLNNAIPSASAVYNISIDYPNGTTFLPSVLATPQGSGLFNYSIVLNVTGEYAIHEFCYDGTYSYSNTEPIIVTYNGNPSPEGITIVFFSICFLIVIGVLGYLFIYNLGHFAQLDYDLGDLIKNVSAYFVLVGLYFLSAYYMGNKLIDTMLVWIMGITGFTNVAMSFLALIICLMIQKRKIKEEAW